MQAGWRCCPVWCLHRGRHYISGALARCAPLPLLPLLLLPLPWPRHLFQRAARSGVSRETARSLIVRACP